MIDLQSHEHQTLREISRAGSAGLWLRETRISVAIRLELAGLAKIVSGVPQRVVITQQGTAFLRRQVFA